MYSRSAIYISAVSRELKSARQLVANTLKFLGYEPQWQEIETGEQDLRPILRHRIDTCKGVVQLVGNRYGPEPRSIDEKFGRVSYAQFEALYAASKGKKVWYLFLDEGFPTEAHEVEDQEKQKLQEDYRARVKATEHLYHPLSSTEGLEASVLKLRDDLTQLRSGLKRWTVLVAALVVASVGLTVWLLQSQQHSNQELQVLQVKLDQLKKGVAAFTDVQSKVRQERPGQTGAEIENKTYEELGKLLGVDPVTLKNKLPGFAKELKKAPSATTYQRAKAAYVAKDCDEAERLALTAADAAQQAGPSKRAEAIEAFHLAAWVEEDRVEYAEALKLLRDAEKLTDHDQDPLGWLEVQHAIARVLWDQGQYSQAEPILRAVLEERTRSLGPENPDTLLAGNNLANTLNEEGKFAEAEKEFRAVLKLRQKVLGSENPETLKTYHNVAYSLYLRGKYSDAEAECRNVLSLKEKVLGPEARSTLMTRSLLAATLVLEGRYAQAETELRELLRLRVKVLGPENPDTLTTRGDLVVALTNEAKFAEAEAECRVALELKEKVLGPEHPETLKTLSALTAPLLGQGKFVEAETNSRGAIRLLEKALGPRNPVTLQARSMLAQALFCQAKLLDAETESRAVLKLQEEVLGAEHEDTLSTRVQLAGVLNERGKYTEAEAEERTIINLAERALGPEHAVTLEARNGLAEALDLQSKHSDAESEYRATLKLQERALGPEHTDALRTCYDLAVCLRSQGRFDEASGFAKRAAEGARKVLGVEHPDTKKYEKLQQELLAKAS